MSLRSWLRRRWVALMAPELESAMCPCGTYFYRRISPYPDQKCDACRDVEMDLWIARLRGSVG